MSHLPAIFLNYRRTLIQIAADRVFRGSTEPLPEMPAWEPYYRPLPDNSARWEAERIERAKACIRRNRSRAKKKLALVASAHPREQTLTLSQDAARRDHVHWRNPA